MAKGIRNMALDLGEGCLIDERSLCNPVLGAWANFHGGDFSRQLGNKGIVNLILHINTVRTHTGLTHIAKFRRDSAFDGGIQIGIIKYDEGCIAAELEAQGYGALAAA